MSPLQHSLAALQTAFQQFNHACEQSALPDYAKPSVLFALYLPATRTGSCVLTGDPEAVAQVLGRAAKDEGNEGFRDALGDLVGDLLDE